MTHLTPEALKRLAAGELPEGELLAALRHLGECAECARAVSAADASHAVEAVRRAIAVTPPDEHLDFDTQLLPYVEQRAGAAEREVIETHLEHCATCAAEAADLAEVARRVRPRRGARVAMAIAAAAAAVLVAVAVFRAPEAKPPAVVRKAPAVVAAPAPPLPSAPQPARPRYRKPQWVALVTAAVARGRLPVSPLLAKLRPAPDVLRGNDDDAPRVLAPVGVVLDETRPRFRWSRVEGATYEVAVFDGERRVAASGTLHEPEWRPPQALPRGRTYAWQVTVTRGDETEILPSASDPRALFHIITPEQQQAISEAQAEYPNDFLLHAVVLAEAGFEDEANAALDRAAAAGSEEAKKIRSAPD